MALMTAILDRLPSLRNSKDFSTIIPDLQDRLSIVEAEADDLKAEQEEALFGAPDKREAVRAKIAANQAEQEELRVAIAGAERRQKEAAFAEQQAGLEKQSEKARKLQREILGKYIKLDEHMAAAAQLLNEIRSGEAEIQSVHVLVSQHNRKDLDVRSPWWHLSSVLGAAMQGHVNEHPVQTAVLPGYYPLRHPDGPALSRIKDVKL